MSVGPTWDNATYEERGVTCICRLTSEPDAFPVSYDQSTCPTHGPGAPHYFVDHETIHDRITGKHVDAAEAVALLNRTERDRLLRELVRRFIHAHPHLMPWTVDHDRTIEVLDANKACVMKGLSDPEARELIALGEETQRTDAEATRVLNQVLTDAGIDP